MPELITTFRNDLAQVSWRELRIHLQRDAIILVAPKLDMVTTAVAVAEDDSARVEQWIASGELTKPTSSQLENWENALDKPFWMLIVKPFILIQENSHD